MENAGFQPLRRERAIDAVYQALHSAIVTCLIRPGERLNIEALAEQLGVSLTPVRGAVQQLATEGLIEIRPRSGTFVASLSTRDVEETFKIRCALECLAAEDALGHLKSKDLQRLKELLKLLRKPVRSEEDRRAHEGCNSEFHQILIRASRNRRLIEIYEALNAHIKIARVHASDANWRERLKEEHEEHESIMSAIEAKDEKKLKEALRRHIERAKDALVATLSAKNEVIAR